jgi:hypothetical protein
MRKKWRAIGTVLVVIIAGSLVFYLSRSKEPTYEGRTLTQWLDKYAMDTLRIGTPNLDAPQHADSIRAIRAIGTNGIPTLLQLLESQDLAGSKGVESFVQRTGWKTFHLSHAADRHWRARLGFFVLGTNANSAAPALRGLLITSPIESAWDIGSSLRSVEPPGWSTNTSAAAK